MLDALDKLGQYPILQFFGGLLILGGVAFAIFRGERDKGKTAPPEPPELRWYFDGPLLKAIDAMEGMYREMKEMRREAQDAHKERREHHREHMDAVRDMIERMPRRRQ